MQRTFFKDEPALAGCGINPSNLSESLQRYMVGDLSAGKALLAVDGTDRLLGVCLGGEVTKDSRQKLLQKANDCGDERAATLLRFWAHLVQVSSLPEVLGASRSWEVEKLATDPAARGRGIAKELTVQSLALALQNGFPTVCVFCTSEFSGRLCRSLKMRHLVDFPYSKYRDQHGRQLISPPPPHERVSIYGDDLRAGHTSTANKSKAKGAIQPIWAAPEERDGELT
ncbi:arylalkylamine N-acetyltransferase-like 2 [Schistocerca serialis cubense]|uniref:arylalkylamine N-acetyltransferase-like 2 n=1 Tax=Schistocerca serialis cubense TaxID=2023355 RepID=UPI00214EB9ED|nr:arylalkylamine N-acetyltransferase-like 2 [Schistocerca serialis cubense]